LFVVPTMRFTFVRIPRSSVQTGRHCVAGLVLDVDGDEAKVGRLVGLHEVEHGSLGRGAGRVLLKVEAKGILGDAGQRPGLEMNRGDPERPGLRGAGDDDVQDAVGDAGFVHVRLREADDSARSGGPCKPRM
jgi:hypothetical protein